MREIAPSETLLARIEMVSGFLLLVFSLGAWAGYSFRAAVGVLLGGGIAILSFQVLKWQLRRAFEKTERLPKKVRLFAGFYLRFLATLFLVFLGIYLGWATPIAFLVGLSVMVLSIVLVGGFEVILTAAKKGES